MTGRIRHLSDNNIRVCYQRDMLYIGKDAYIPTIDEIEHFKINQNLRNMMNDAEIDNSGLLQKVQQSPFTRVFAENYLEIYKSRVMFMSILKEMITEKNLEYYNDDINMEEDPQDNTEENNVEPKEESKGKTNSSSAKDNENIIIYNDPIEISTKCSTKNKYEIQEMLNAPDINDREILEYERRKRDNTASHWDKIIIKRYYFKKKFKLDELTDDFICAWYNREYILDYMLYALGRKTTRDLDDPLFKNMQNKVDYMEKILELFGFKDMLDFETKVELTNELRKKIMESEFTNYDYYKNLMMTFNKTIKKKIKKKI